MRNRETKLIQPHHLTQVKPNRPDPITRIYQDMNIVSQNMRILVRSALDKRYFDRFLTWCTLKKPIRHLGQNVQTKKINISDYWFDYGKKSIFGDVNKKLAKEIIELWGEAESWWNKDPYEQKLKR